MGRVSVLRHAAGAGLLVLVAVLFLFARGNSVTEATTFNPTSGVLVADPSPGANSSVTLNTFIPLGDSMFSALDYVSFIPGDWTLATDASIPNGSIVGSSNSSALLGAFNSFCGIIALPAIVAFLEATTDTAGPLVDFEDTDGNGVGEWFEDPAGGVLPPAAPPDIRIRRGVTEYPANLVALFPEPRLRYFGYLDAAGTNVGVNLLFFDPGDLSGLGFSADKGYPLVLTIQRLGDPLDPGDPGSALTDFCNLAASVTVNGFASFNPFTGGAPFAPIPQATNPGAGDYEFRTFFRSGRDADNDSIENGLDTCPISFISDSTPREPGAPAPVPPTNPLVAAGPPPVPSTQDPDGWIDLYVLTGGVVGLLGSDPTDISIPEGIDSSCDPDPSTPCGPGPFDDFFGLDCDLDGHKNRTDNCPLVANVLQEDTDTPFGGVAPDLGPATDSIGDACDSGGPAPGLSPTVPNGHYHMSVFPQGGLGPLCTTTPVDTCGPIDTTGTASPVVSAPLPSFPFPDSAYLTQTVTIGKHGVKLAQLGGPKVTKPNATRNYTVDVSNQSSTDSQDIVVQLSVTVVNGTCPSPTIDGQAVASLMKTANAVPPDGNAEVSFSVDFGTCGDPGAGSPDYILTVDACHPGDAAPLGFGGAACPGVDPHHVQDSDPSNDVPVSKGVNEI